MAARAGERLLEVRVHTQTSSELLVERGPLLVRAVDGAATSIEDIDFACAQFDRMLESYPAIAVLVVVEHGTPVPSFAVARYAAERFGSFGDRMVMGVCMLGLGFWAKAAHAAMTKVIKFVGQSTVVLETDLDDAASELALELVGIDPVDLVEFCEQLRRQLHDH